LNKFRNASGARLTQALFLETSNAPDQVLYSLKDEDQGMIPSLYLKYMEMDDPLELRFANTYLDGLEHWLMIANATFFKEYAARWRYTLELRLKSTALANIIHDANSNSKTKFASNKLLLEGGWKPKEAPRVSKGRPSTAQIKEAAYELASHDKTLLDDFTRIIGKSN
jgi:hypothetical protein